MAALIPKGSVAWGLQLPVQAQSTIFAQPWEAAAGPAELVQIAQAADRAGALYVGVCDHIAIPEPADQAMGTTWYDSVATLAYLAAKTTSVNLLSHVFVLPYRPALMTAKAFVTLDALSGGRAILGAGAGHVADEFAALGVDFDNRGPAVADAIGVIRSAFENHYVEVEAQARAGEQADTRSLRVGIAPRPVRPGGPPIWIGGSSRPAITRAARLADGWLPQGPPSMGLSAAIEFIRSTRADAGLLEDFDIGITGGPIFVGEPGVDLTLPEHTMVGDPEQLAERIARMTARGVNQLQFQFMGRDAAQVCDQIERFGADVAPLVQP
ncbi:MAG: TIGR03619 family F420-dependent LLM class oxidoreductase [Microthrixaceae bacterium]|nr:TIGR03619 family F420-dependent LLM class oxidoreductase [Microthrixaceae bacterium]